MKSLLPLWNLWRPRIARLARMHATSLHPLAPFDMHLRCALRMANLERRP